jgi:hypothetical protein
MLKVIETYLLPMDERVYAAYGVSEAAQRAEKVLAWLESEVRHDSARTTVNGREARRALRDDTPEGADDAVEWLCSRNWLRSPRQSATGAVGTRLSSTTSTRLPSRGGRSELCPNCPRARASVFSRRGGFCRTA